MLRLGVEDEPTLRISRELVKTISVAKCTACLVDLYINPESAADKKQLKACTVAEIRELRAKCGAKEESLLHNGLNKRVKAALSGK